MSSRRSNACPLGFDNSMCELPYSACENYRFCDYQTLSWSLPYIFDADNSALIVTNLDPRCYRHDPVTHSYRECYLLSFIPIIEAAWREAGWWPAVYNKRFVNGSALSDYDVNGDYDPIPF